MRVCVVGRRHSPCERRERGGGVCRNVLPDPSPRDAAAAASAAAAAHKPSTLHPTSVITRIPASPMCQAPSNGHSTLITVGL